MQKQSNLPSTIQQIIKYWEPPTNVASLWAITVTNTMLSPLLLLLTSSASTEASEASLGVSHDSYGNFTVSLNGKLWLSGGETRVYDYSSSDGTLKLLSQAS